MTKLNECSLFGGRPHTVFTDSAKIMNSLVLQRALYKQNERKFIVTKIKINQLGAAKFNSTYINRGSGYLFFPPLAPVTRWIFLLRLGIGSFGVIERFHMTLRQPYWLCSKTMKRRPCWCTKPILWELNSFLMYLLFQ